MPHPYCPMQWRLAMCLLGIHICPVLQQQSHHIKMRPPLLPNAVVSRHSFFWPFTFAPFSNNNLTTSTCCTIAAQCSGVHPSFSWAFTFAPFSNNNLTTSTCSTLLPNAVASSHFSFGRRICPVLQQQSHHINMLPLCCPMQWRLPICFWAFTFACSPTTISPHQDAPPLLPNAVVSPHSFLGHSHLPYSLTIISPHQDALRCCPMQWCLPILFLGIHVSSSPITISPHQHAPPLLPNAAVSSCLHL